MALGCMHPYYLNDRVHGHAHFTTILKRPKPGVVMVHTYNFRNWREKEEDSGTKLILDYTASSRPAQTMQDFTSKEKKINLTS